MQLVAGPASWQPAQDTMSRRAAVPWKLLDEVLVPTHSGGCGFAGLATLALTPRAAWHESQPCGV